MKPVSIIIPCFNEQETISSLLQAIFDQTYSRRMMEVVIADGMSTDSTRQRIAEFQSGHTGLDLQVVDNPRRIIPAALNCAIRASSGQILIRLDAHARPYPDYVERCVKALESDLGENVGGVWEIRPRRKGWLAEAIAAAAADPLAVGDAYYRHTDRAGYVDTVPFFAIRRDLLARVGTFDENLWTNEDYEFNVRISKADGRIWLDPAIRSIYYAQPGLNGLARQYGRYGYWKWHMLRKYPGTIRWRQALPPLFVFSLVFSCLMGFFFPFFWYLLAAELVIYCTFLVLDGILHACSRKRAAMVIGLPLAIAVMHFAWGSGFLAGMLSGRRNQATLLL